MPRPPGRLAFLTGGASRPRVPPCQASGNPGGSLWGLVACKAKFGSPPPSPTPPSPSESLAGEHKGLFVLPESGKGASLSSCSVCADSCFHSLLHTCSQRHLKDGTRFRGRDTHVLVGPGCKPWATAHRGPACPSTLTLGHVSPPKRRGFVFPSLSLG